MKASLARWIGDADGLRHLADFNTLSLASPPAVRSRPADYYLALVGDLFERFHADEEAPSDWARLGNALLQFGSTDRERVFPDARVAAADAQLFAAAAFYCGGFPASAYLVMRSRGHVEGDSVTTTTCVDLLARPAVMRSSVSVALIEALRLGDLSRLSTIEVAARADAVDALAIGPDQWIPARLLERLLARFLATNVRAVLPNGADTFWTALVGSFLDQSIWEFFPSQIQAINAGLLTSDSTFSLQMPTGAGKTALCETLLYWHAGHSQDAVAVLLVPYRSLASELRESVVKRLNAMGISARCAYGGTVPTGDEVQDLAGTRVMVATPEALAGLLNADAGFLGRIGLVICGEGHLLDGVGRGVSLELLLTRLRSREAPPRFVFVSAIVPNIEEVNAWLGGTTSTVVRSEYRPALAEFAVLRESGSGVKRVVDLQLHPHETAEVQFRLQRFLAASDFHWVNRTTSRRNVYSFGTVKTQAIAAARKCLALGAVAVFAANKHGNQGAVGLAEELLDQAAHALPLPEPSGFVAGVRVAPAMDYLVREYGLDWIGTRALQVGAVLHHGDIPQETREVLERLLRRGHIRFAICTSTLAEGVNLPIRTIVLYSVQRRGKTGRAETLLARDIKNLVGRAGRAGSSTKGLVICANEEQWSAIEPVAKQAAGEPVTGALRKLVSRLQTALAAQNLPLSNDVLDSTPALHTLIDGVDSTLIDLATEEIGEEELVSLAARLADETFASRMATLQASRQFLQRVFELRARRIVGIRTAGRLQWIRETGARARMLESVERDLLPRRASWDDIESPTDPTLLEALLDWAWTQPELREALLEAYRLEDGADASQARVSFLAVVTAWVSGKSFVDMASETTLPMDELLRIHSTAVAFVLQTLLEQAIALLERFLLAQGKSMANAVREFPENLRFGVPTRIARALAARGLRHRRAAVDLGATFDELLLNEDRAYLFPIVRSRLDEDREGWIERLGQLVFDRTLEDVS